MPHFDETLLFIPFMSFISSLSLLFFLLSLSLSLLFLYVLSLLTFLFITFLFEKNERGDSSKKVNVWKGLQA